ncbi:MAG: hypothetical protein ACOYBJ_02190 [Patescibacteria group bacterium]
MPLPVEVVRYLDHDAMAEALNELLDSEYSFECISPACESIDRWVDANDDDTLVAVLKRAKQIARDCEVLEHLDDLLK